MLAHLDVSGDYSVALLLPVGGPSGLKESEWQSAAPTPYAGHLPAADEGVRKAICIAEDLLSLAERQQVDPVRGDQVTGVEIGNAAIQLGLPGVDDGAERPVVGGVGSVLGAAFRIGTFVDRIGHGVAEVHLQAVAHWVAERDLTGIVVAHAHTRE